MASGVARDCASPFYPILRRRERSSVASLLMRRAVLVVLALLAPASGAQAATLTLDHSCYLAKQPALKAGQQVVAVGRGFKPFAPVTLSLPTGPVAARNADGNGEVRIPFSSPGLYAPQFKATRTLTANDGTSQATAPLPLRLLAADFLPSTTQNAVKQKVRFYVYGFGPVLTALNRSTIQTVYMHVFQPGGRRRGPFNVGRTSGPCGDLRTAKRKILPFGLKPGTWTYRFTTAKRYSSKSTPQVEIGFRVRTVFRP